MNPVLILLAAQTLTLADVEKNARTNLPSIHIAQAQTAVQKAVRDISASAYAPQVNGALSDFIAVQPNPTYTGASFGNRLSASVQASQLIYDFNQTSGRIEAGDASISAAQDSERGVWNTALLTVRAAYFTAQGDKELIRVAQANLDSQQKHVDQMSAFVQHGTHAPIDLAQAQQQKATAQYQLVQARGAYGQARAALQQAMGLDRAPDYDVADEPFAPVPDEEKTTDELLNEALGARPEIANIQDQVRAQQLLVSVNGAGWLPSIEASGSAGVALFSPFVPTGPQQFSPTAQIGASLSWPFFQGGRVGAQTRQAEAQLVALQAQLESQRQQIRNDVDVAKVALSTSTEQLASAREALKFAQEQLKLAEGQYAAGVGIALQVFDAQVAVTTSGGQVAQSVAAQAIARAQLLRALGREKY
jgi:outer membrane protein